MNKIFVFILHIIKNINLQWFAWYNLRTVSKIISHEKSSRWLPHRCTTILLVINYYYYFLLFYENNIMSPPCRRAFKSPLRRRRRRLRVQRLLVVWGFVNNGFWPPCVHYSNVYIIVSIGPFYTHTHTVTAPGIYTFSFYYNAIILSIIIYRIS